MPQDTSGVPDRLDDMGRQEGVDIKSISLRDLLTGIGHLKLSSGIFLSGLLIALFGGGMTANGFRTEPQLAELRGEVGRLDSTIASQADLAEAIATRLLDPAAIAPLVRAVADLEPDGLATMDQIRASLSWQLRAQGGFAEFLSGQEAHKITASFDDDSINLAWDEAPNIVLRILQDVGIDASHALLYRLSSELNRRGVADLPNGDFIVRASDGVQVVGSQKS